MRFLLPSLFCISSLYSLYNGNPAIPSVPEEGFFIAKEAWMSIRAAYEGDLIYRPMNNHLHKCRIYENFGVVTLNFSERLDLYAAVGSFSSSLRRTADHKRWEFEVETAAAWKVGARGILWEYGDTFLTLHLGYERASPKIREVVLNGSPLERKQGKLFYHEIEGSVGVAHQIDFFIPYIGIESSCVQAKIRDVSRGEFKSRNRIPVGLFLGCGFSPGTKAIVNFEVRLADEQAISLGIDLRF